MSNCQIMMLVLINYYFLLYLYLSTTIMIFDCELTLYFLNIVLDRHANVVTATSEQN